MAYLTAEALASAGFTDEIAPRNASVVMNVAGLEGTGKTSWALTAPKPLFYMGTDFGLDGVIQKASGQIIRPRGKDGKPKEYKIEIPHELRPFVDREEKPDARLAREGKLANWVHDNFYSPFFDDYSTAVKAGVRSVVWDTAQEVWEYVRLSVYGRAATNRDDLKTESNGKFKEMIRLSNLNNVNLIMINRLKYRWESYYDDNSKIKWRKTSEFEMDGFDKAPELVAVNLWTKVTPAPPNAEDPKPTFEVIVRKNRDNADLVGSTLPMLPFEELMGILIPSVNSWE